MGSKRGIPLIVKSNDNCLSFVCGVQLYFSAMNVDIHFISSSESTTVGNEVNISCHIEGDDIDFYDFFYIVRNGLPICKFYRYACNMGIMEYLTLINEYYSCECDYDYSPQRNVFLNVTIKATRKEDNGIWVCGAKSINESLSLQVKYPPSINNIKILPDDREIKEGTYVKLACLVDSFPQSKLSWTFNGEQINNTGPDVIISKATCEDSGSYTCWAVNGVGDKSSATGQLEVSCAPRLKRSRIQRIYATLAGSATLTATVVSYPVPSFTWIHLLEDQTEEVDDTVNHQGLGNNTKLGTGIGIGFIVGLLVMGIIVVIVFFIWKKRGETGINVRQLILKYKKRSPKKETGTTETAPSTSSSRRCTTVESDDQTYEGLDMENSPKQTYEEINIYENQGAVA
ncbi:hypothetical protein LOTGIDRAFT_155379 [Lottia gigantea]|uniref:Ig-like domain-containing protein n=1 Tax=Lottia gigantea TaxID=225164 RepID=V4B6C1_LOTGI|nr:hypothetical protein LOTGIDRAFT_155379 [Lottia gigantea]ESO84064.1 hypothetical protein LOTGIDRAFT_155379 [Lottia gigantea]